MVNDREEFKEGLQELAKIINETYCNAEFKDELSRTLNVLTGNNKLSYLCERLIDIRL